MPLNHCARKSLYSIYITHSYVTDCLSGQDWKSETAGGNLGLTDMMMSQFIIMNMLHKDITVEELSSEQIIDIQQSEMMQLARPLSGKKDGFKFNAMLKDTKKAVMINGQMILAMDLNDLSMMNILVVHDEGTMIYFIHGFSCFIAHGLCKELN